MLSVLFICFLVGLFVVMLCTKGGRAFLGGLFAIGAIGLGIIFVGAIVIGAIILVLVGVFG